MRLSEQTGAQKESERGREEEGVKKGRRGKERKRGRGRPGEGKGVRSVECVGTTSGCSS